MSKPPRYVAPLRLRLRNPEPSSTPPESTLQTRRDEAIDAAFQQVLRQQSELASAIDQLRTAITETSGRDIRIGHNQGPPIQIEEPDAEGAQLIELDAESAHLLALLQDKGPNLSPAERGPIAEQAEKMPTLYERISTLAAECAKLGAREVAKKVTAPLWEEVARRLLDLYHAIKIWLSLL